MPKPKPVVIEGWTVVDEGAIEKPVVDHETMTARLVANPCVVVEKDGRRVRTTVEPWMSHEAAIWRSILSAALTDRDLARQHANRDDAAPEDRHHASRAVFEASRLKAMSEAVVLRDAQAYLAERGDDDAPDLEPIRVLVRNHGGGA